MMHPLFTDSLTPLRYSVSDEPRKYVDNTMELIRCVSGPASAAE
ncbi:MAG: hypothetical protein ACI4OZ_04620 [Akkermansia sp.]